MKTLLPLLALLGAVSCGPATGPLVPGLLPATRESTAVVRAVLQQGGFVLTSQGPNGEPVAALLAPVHFAPVQAPGQLPPPPRPVGYFAASVNVLHRLNTSLNPQEAAELAPQRGALLDAAAFAPGDVLPGAGYPTNLPARYLWVSQPVFSHDSLRAYVGVDRVCQDCGGGWSYLLHKKGSAWEIVDSYRRWYN